ncbi:hypothetical protein A2573_02535 [Candidatus Woesebacteria bacterium RIFOXYD1_FULL_43_18]|uniref:Peptidase C39-like domain-containing protein n=1 Tax=Candidatus Woesebacteria bacterium RIFOXYD1_FULL_43_18 TaxID=1802551 RepID=A0A1F8DI19_9BACT|nr:MAG: hypothetical protein A2573_02535 [Candidatus Woesebacteria bacterium RIFOXYD1_FULL_43_18]
MKIVKAFSNTPSNDYCLQACVQSVLDFYFKNKKFSESEISLNTQYYSGHFSWSPATVVWLDNLGLKVKLCIPNSFDYKEFASDGLKYLRKILPPTSFNMMSKRGDYTYLPDIQKSAQKILDSKLLVDKAMEIDKLEKILENEKSLAIGKTMHEWLDNRYTVGTNHYAVIVKKYSPGKWLIEDPDLPFHPDRKVNQLINNQPMFPELIVIYGIR